MSLFDELCDLFLHECYHTQAARQSVGCAGISILCMKMPDRWLRDRLLNLIRAVLFVLRVCMVHLFVIEIIKGSPLEVNVGTSEDATDALALLITRVVGDIKVSYRFRSRWDIDIGVG